jgi:penicillin-binding protein 1C
MKRLRSFVRAHARVSVGMLTALAAAGVAALWVRLGPLPDGLLDVHAGTSTIVVDRHGVPLYESLSAEGTRSVLLSPSDLPPVLVAATVAAEDRRFWRHPGVDPFAILRALERNVLSGEVVEGGSTITQQVAKLLLNRQGPPRHRGIAAKLQEAVLALRLEHRLSKREILAWYLNLAAYGNQVVGAQRASRQYFNQDVALVTPAQAAFLAGLPQRPSGFNPYRSQAAAIARQHSVLRRMAAWGMLAPDAAHEAAGERLALSRSGRSMQAPHFVEMALASVAGPRPARLRTTIDALLQQEIADIVESRMAALQEQHGAFNVAVVVLDNATAEWRAWQGSADHFDDRHGGAINGPLVARQPGSALKPFTYALAFENGQSPATVLPDVPLHFPTAEAGVLYSPRNYDGSYRGPLLARRALAGSENVPAVALASTLGVPTLLRFLLRAGFTTFDRNASYYGLGITLGNAEVRLDELVAAYSAFARGGVFKSPVYVADARRDSGRALVSLRTAFWITDVLADPVAREYTFGRGGSLEFPFPVAVKTGTSQAYHDNWTVGYSRRVTVGVWVGNFDRTPLRDSSGVTGAAPIFHAVMVAAERRAESEAGDAPQPAVFSDDTAQDAGLVRREICAVSGMTANAWCPIRRAEWLPPEAPALPCNWHHLSESGLVTVWPAEYREWAQKEGLETPPQPERAVFARQVASAAPRAAARARISSPPDGGTYLVDPTLHRDFQALPLRVVTPAPALVQWRVDGRTLASVSSETTLRWPLRTGRHTFEVRDQNGPLASATISVR